MNLEVSYDYHWNELTRITPSNFPNYPPHKFGILYTFENQEVGQSVSRVVMGMSTRNNSYCGYGWDFPNDGKVDKATVKLGKEQFVDVKVEKYLYHPEGAKCKRDQPYNDMVIDKISDEMKRRCSRTCRPQNFWICNKAKSNDIPVCKNQTEERCFGQVKDLVKNDIPKSACTKLQYVRAAFTTDPIMSHDYSKHMKHQAGFVIRFPEPPMVTVREEYLIYDMIAMISSIGGTLGICVGISFMEIFSFVLGLYQYIPSKDKEIKRKTELNHSDSKISPHNTQGSEMDFLLQQLHQIRAKVLANEQKINIQMKSCKH